MQARFPLAARAAAPRQVRRALSATLVGCVLAVVSAGSAATAPDVSGRSWAPGRMYLKLRAADGGTVRKAGPALRAALGTALDTARPLVHARGPQPAGLDRLLAVDLPAATDVPRLAAKLSRLPEVEYATPVYLYDLAAADGAQQIEATPNDPAYLGAQQAYLANLQVESAWDVQKSETGVPRPIVCVVDGGTNWQHEDLLANMWTNPGEIPGNGIDDDGNGYIDDIHGWNFRNNNGNPRGDAATPSNANHGSHTGGLLAAVTNNGVGVASASWNPSLMAVCATGTSDGTIAYGYEGILYAAENGARVISLSWGGNGGSPAEQDIIDFATADGALVVAAAGNNNNSIPFYPAAYRGVIAVANVQNSDVRYNGPSGSCFGGWLDVAAPGTSLYSLFDNGVTNSYGLSTGTSMACPVAAAVAALVTARHPSWGPLKIGEQVRISCDNINGANPGFIDQLGRGRVNALRAVTLTSPAVRVTSWTFADADGNGQLNQGETVVMSLGVHDYLAPAVSPSYTLIAPSQYITLIDATQAGSTLLEDADATLPNAFSFTVGPNVPPGTKIDVRVDITAAGYSDFQYIPVVLEPLFETHDANALHVSMTGTGGIGWVGFPSAFGDEGDGWSYAGSPNLLFEGALLLGTSAGHLSDAARVSNEHTDFAPVLHQPPVKVAHGPSGDQEIHAAYTDTINTTTPLGVRVDQTSWASANPAGAGFVLVAFDVKNRTTAAFDSLWAGLFCDWDIDETHFDTNRTAYDAGRQLGYAFDTSTASLPYTGVMALTGVTAGFSAINNGGPGLNILDGFSKAEKWDVLQGGTGQLTAGPGDISNALSSGPYRVAAGGHALVVFALVGGSDLAGLQANADRARSFFADSVLTDVGDAPGVRAPAVYLGPAVPNPFNPTTRIPLDLREARVITVGVYDARGRLVTTLFEGWRAPGHYDLTWNGSDRAGRTAASGVYFARLRSGSVTQVRRLVLAK